MTTIFLMRHSKVCKDFIFDKSDSLQVQNEKYILSEDGEQLALNFSKQDLFNNIDAVISSNYVRAISTAKYFLKNCSLSNKINIMSQFSERKHGVDDWNQLPKDFEKKQFENENFKVLDGESRYEVTERMDEGIKLVLKLCKGKNVLVVSHATAITFLLMKYCKRINGNLYFNDEVIIGSDFCWDYLDTFKLVFDDNDDLIDISLFRNNL